MHGDNVRMDSLNFYNGYIKRFDGTRRNIGEEVKKLGAAACAEYDEAKRNEMWVDFWKAVKDDAIYYSLYHRHNPYIATKDLNVVWGVNYFDIYDWSWNA